MIVRLLKILPNVNSAIWLCMSAKPGMSVAMAALAASSAWVFPQMFRIMSFVMSGWTSKWLLIFSKVRDSCLWWWILCHICSMISKFSWLQRGKGEGKDFISWNRCRAYWLSTIKCKGLITLHQVNCPCKEVTPVYCLSSNHFTRKKTWKIRRFLILLCFVYNVINFSTVMSRQRYHSKTCIVNRMRRHCAHTCIRECNCWMRWNVIWCGRKFSSPPFVKDCCVVSVCNAGFEAGLKSLYVNDPQKGAHQHWFWFWRPSYEKLETHKLDDRTPFWLCFQILKPSFVGSLKKRNPKHSGSASQLMKPFSKPLALWTAHHSLLIWRSDANCSSLSFMKVPKFLIPFGKPRN